MQHQNQKHLRQLKILNELLHIAYEISTDLLATWCVGSCKYRDELIKAHAALNQSRTTFENHVMVHSNILESSSPNP